MPQAPRHRTSAPLRDFGGEVVYLAGRIALIVLLLAAAIALVVGGIVLVTWLAVTYLQHYVNG